MELKTKKSIAREFIIILSFAGIIGLTYVGGILREEYLEIRRYHYFKEYNSIADTLNDYITNIYIRFYFQIYDNIKIEKPDSDNKWLYKTEIDNLFPPVTYRPISNRLFTNYVSLSQFRDWLYLKGKLKDFQFIDDIYNILDGGTIRREIPIIEALFSEHKTLFPVIMYRDNIEPSLKNFNKNIIPNYFEINYKIENSLFMRYRINDKCESSAPELYAKIAAFTTLIIYPLRLLLLAFIWAIRILRK